MFPSFSWSLRFSCVHLVLGVSAKTAEFRILTFVLFTLSNLGRLGHHPRQPDHTRKKVNLWNAIGPTFFHLNVLFNINLLLCATVRVLEAQEKPKVRKRKNECFMQNTSWVSTKMSFRILAPNPGNLGPQIFWRRSFQREPTIQSCMVSKVGWIALATRATNLKSLVKSVKSRGPRKNQEIRFGLKPTHFLSAPISIYRYI